MRNKKASFAGGLAARLLLLCLAMVLNPFQAIASRSLQYPQSGVALASGWNSDQEEKISTVCITGKPYPSKYQDRHESLDVVNDTESLDNSLNISASLQVNAMGGHGGAQAKFAQGFKFSQSSLSVVVQAAVLNGPTFVVPIDVPSAVGSTMLNPSFPTQIQTTLLVNNGTNWDVNSLLPASKAVDLSSDMAALAKTDRATFYKTCGDSFVAAILEGARIGAVVSFLKLDANEESEVSLAVNGGGIGWDAKGAFAEKMAKYQASSQLHIDYDQSGGFGGALPTDEAGILDAVKQLPDQAKTNPKPFEIILQRYDTLPSWPEAEPSPEISPKAELARRYSRLLYLYNVIDDALLHDSDYWSGVDTTTEDSKKLQDHMLDDKAILEKIARGCSTTPVCDPDYSSLYAKTDYDYRVHMPVPLGPQTFERGDIGYWDITNVQGWVLTALRYAQIRQYYWILRPSIQRCDLFNECLSNRERDIYYHQITNAEYATFPEEVKKVATPSWVIYPAGK